MLQPGRKYTNGSGYRYGFNGKENDNEVKGEGNQQDYGFRIYDPRIGRFLSVDPLKKKYPYYSTYQFTGNNPIKYIDLDGLEPANNPQVPGAKEERAITEATVINTQTKISNAADNLVSPGFWKDDGLKGPISCNPSSAYVTDTKGDPGNKFNMKVNNGVTLNVDESQASRFRDYESFVVNQLMSNFVSGNGTENYNFPTNGIISNKFLVSDILKDALQQFKSGKVMEGEAYQSSFGLPELARDVVRTGKVFTSITGFVGSGTVTIKKTDKNMVMITIFNITSLTSGDLLKNPNNDTNWPKSYVRDPDKRTPYGNISQTFNLLLPTNSPLLQ